VLIVLTRPSNARLRGQLSSNVRRHTTLTSSRLQVDPLAIRAKFGDDYWSTEQTHRLGIDVRITRLIAKRFSGRSVFESCTGAGFTTISLARAARHVVSVEIEPEHLALARKNLERAGVLDRVNLIEGDCLSDAVAEQARQIDCAVLDPDWAVSGPDHVFKFRGSNMRPPADMLFHRVLGWTPDIAMILPPTIDLRELRDLPDHEHQYIYLDQVHALHCLYFGALASTFGKSELYA
jgi:SAM-dependent methyltransferase